MPPKRLSQKEQKLIRSLQIKKYRDESGLFVAEGPKVIETLLPHFTLELLVANSGLELTDPQKARIATDDELRKLSGLTSPASQIALFRLPGNTTDFGLPQKGITVVLDNIQNPGNLGTIIRLCDWLGIKTLIMNGGTADPFSPKVVQATAGALGNVRLIRTGDLRGTLDSLGFERVIGTSLGGTPVSHISSISPDEHVAVLFGNEGHGLSEELEKRCTELLLIPPAETTVSESLNVSVSAAILLSRLAGL